MLPSVFRVKPSLITHTPTTPNFEFLHCLNTFVIAHFLFRIWNAGKHHYQNYSDPLPPGFWPTHFLFFTTWPPTFNQSDITIYFTHLTLQVLDTILPNLSGIFFVKSFKRFSDTFLTLLHLSYFTLLVKTNYWLCAFFFSNFFVYALVWNLKTSFQKWNSELQDLWGILWSTASFLSLTYMKKLKNLLDENLCHIFLQWKLLPYILAMKCLPNSVESTCTTYQPRKMTIFWQVGV